MLTGDTITDEQIRDLRTSYRVEDRMWRVCTSALGLTRGGAPAQRRARARCAEILNARAKEGKQP